jgi:EmrB/QacA subfamily drug resistance transporter
MPGPHQESWMTDTTAPARDTAPAGSFTHRQILTILGGLMLGMFLAALDQTVVATSIRTIADDLQGFSLQAWATTAFLITSTISTPLYGKLSDIYGRKPFFLAAIAVFLFGSALCGFSQSMYELAAFRAIQGIGAGGLFSMALAIIGDIVPPRERSKYQGYILAVFGTSSVLGPVIGGLLAGTTTIAGVAGWRWIFYLNIPVGFAALVVVTRVLHLPHDRRQHRIDWPGALALVVCLVPLLIVAEQGRTWGWDSGRALTCYVIGAVGLALFLAAERSYGEDALLPLQMMRGRTFAVGSASSLIVGMGMFGALAVLPQYLQIVKGSTPTVGGLQMLPLVLGIMSGAVASGQFIARTGRYKIFPVMGTSLMVLALLLFSLVGAETPLWRTMIVMLLFGLGLGFNMQPIILAVQNAVPPRQMGVATSSVTFFRQMGGALGTAIFLSVLFSTLTGNISDDIRSASRTPAFQEAVAQHPEQASFLRGGAGGGGPGSALEDTSFITRLDSRLAAPFRSGFSNSMDLIFLLAAGVLTVGVVSTLLLPELPLRNQSGIQARADEDAARSDPSGIPSDVAPGFASPAAAEHVGTAGMADGERDRSEDIART